jgi:hypothetical protein
VSEDRNAGAFEEHLTAAENYLVMAEDGFTRLLVEPPAVIREDTLRGTQAKMRVALQLAELHRVMAQTYADSIPQRYAMMAPAGMAEMRDAITAQLKEDQAAYDAVRLTAKDPEPESTPGDLWIDDGMPAIFRYLYRLAGGWMWVDSHAEALRSRSIGEPWATALDGGYVVRRPTQEEREAFYAPPADDTPAPEPPCACCTSGLFSGGETCNDCDHGPEWHNGNAPTPGAGGIPVRHVQAKEEPLRFADTVETFTDTGLSEMLDAIIAERNRRNRAKK